MNLRPHIVIADLLPLEEQHYRQLHSLGELAVYDDYPTEDQLIKRIASARIITTNRTAITADVLKHCPYLKYIVVPSVGWEWVDGAAARQRGITVVNCPTHNAQATAELTLALLLAVTRRIVQSQHSFRNSMWRPHGISGCELAGKQAVVVGRGNIGSKTTQMLRSLGMTVHVVHSSTTAKQLDHLLQETDFLILNVPLTPKTHHLIDKRRLSLLKKTAYIVNTSRGAVIDQQALLSTLRQEKIAGAALDVFEGEPLVGKPTEEMMELARLPNVVATQHIGSATVETRYRLGEELIKVLQSCLVDLPINRVNG